MERIIEKYERGIFRYENPLLDFSCTKIEIAANKNEMVTGSFQIMMPQSEKLEGYLHASSLRMRCEIGEFHEDTNSNVIRYTYDTSNLEEGSVTKGEICFITTFGEYSIPFVVEIQSFCIESSIGKIKNLFHFTNLAKSNWDEAVAIFYGPTFANIFRPNEQDFYNIYRGLVHEIGNEKNVDEFLFLIKKKQLVEFIVKEKEFLIEDIETQSLNKIHVKRNGWGYTNVNIEVIGDFISIQKDVLRDSDFLGKNCTLQFVIDEYKLHSGTNYGSIRFTYGFTEEIIPVVVKQKKQSKEHKVMRMKQELDLAMTSFYIEFRSKKITAKEWSSNSLEVIEKITVQDEKNYEARLYQAHMLISAGRTNEAQWILDRLDGLLPDEIEPKYHAYYLYLTTLINRDQKYVDKITEIISSYSKVDPDNWRLAWFLLYLEEKYTSSPVRRWRRIEDLSERGCMSPILYVDAVNLMNGNPHFLTKLEGFDLQVIIFALKKNLLEEEVFEQILYLLIKVKDYTSQLLHTLFHLYDKWENDELLEEICKILIRQNMTDESYYVWYEHAVEKEFRITSLYEFYLLARPIDEAKEIPRTVLLYFAYDCSLSYEITARLYRYVYEHRKDQMEMYRSYKSAIKNFIMEQLDAKHINGDLAFLYQSMLSEDMLNQERAENLATLVFYQKITIELPAITQIVMIYDKLKGENRYYFQNGEVEFPAFGKEYHLMLQDRTGNRYSFEDYQTRTQWMDPNSVVDLLKPYKIDQIGYSLFMCEKMGEHAVINAELEHYYANLLNSTQVVGKFKRRIRSKMLPYYYDSDMMDEMDECLLAVPFKETTILERKELIRFMVLRGMYGQAYDWMIRNGATDMDPKTILRMASRMIRRGECTKYDEKMLELIYYAFRHGEYDEFTTEYLVRYIEGMAKELRDVWLAAIEEELDTRALEERMIVQTLYSGAYVPEKNRIFQAYAKKEPNTRLMNAYLSLQAYDYFVKEKIIDGKIFLHYMQEVLDGKEVNEVCILALMKYFSENKEEIDEDAEEFIWKVYCEYTERSLFLPMFVTFAEMYPKMFGLQDKTFIEYRCNPSKNVVIHYILERADEESGHYRKEKMKNVCYGIFVKDFTLFFGETLQYYITEEVDGEETLTESGKITKADIDNENASMRYCILNDISIANTLQDYETVNGLGEEYSKKSYVTRNLFRML